MPLPFLAFWIVFVIPCDVLVHCFTPKVYFSRSGRIEVLVSLGVIPFKDCNRQCMARPRCKLLVYHTRLKWCRLGSNDIAEEDMVPKSGYVLAYGFSEYHNTNPVCGTRTCSLPETCVEKPGTSQCEITECGYPTNAGSQVKGNLYSVGNTVFVDDSPRLYKVTCSPTGIWQVEKPTLKHMILEMATCLTFNLSNPLTLDILQTPTNPVLCDIQTDGGNWLVFQRRFDGSQDFYRDWDDYTDGFGTVHREFWTGLGKLHTIISSALPDRFELRVDMEDFQGTKVYATYSTFSISGASDFYRLTVGGYSGDAGDSLVYHNGMQFTTKDSDHDTKDGSNCAVEYEGGWWYKNCHNCNLNGVYFNGAGKTGNPASHIIWYKFKGHDYSLKKTEMKIRKIS